MRIEYYHNKKNNTTYVYEAESYYDPSKKRCSAKRKLIGKLDPITKEVVPTGKRGRPRKAQCVQPKEISTNSDKEPAKKNDKDTELAQLRSEVAHLSSEVIKLNRFVTEIALATDKYRASQPKNE